MSNIYSWIFGNNAQSARQNNKRNLSELHVSDPNPSAIVPFRACYAAKNNYRPELPYGMPRSLPAGIGYGKAQFVATGTLPQDQVFLREIGSGSPMLDLPRAISMVNAKESTNEKILQRNARNIGGTSSRTAGGDYQSNHPEVNNRIIIFFLLAAFLFFVTF